MGWFDRKREPARPAGAPGDGGFGAPLHLAYDQRQLPRGGAMSIAFETLALPRYSPIGWGVANKRALRATQQGIAYQHQGVTLGNAAGPGILTGGLVTQPLLDTSNSPTPPLYDAPASYMIPSRKAGG